MRFRFTSLEKANFKTIEHELYNYHQSKQIIKDYEDDVINGSGVAPEIRGTQISNPTEQKAMKLISNTHILEMQKRLRAIDQVISELQESKLEQIGRAHV